MDVARAAKSLIRLGLEPHHGVCVLGFNSPEWFIGYLAAIMVRESGGEGGGGREREREREREGGGGEEGGEIKYNCS